MNKRELIKSVAARLGKVGHGIKFEVVSDGVRREDSWWYVPVLATRNGKEVPREFTVNIFANIEDELEREQHVSVLFIPAVAKTVLRNRVENDRARSEFQLRSRFIRSRLPSTSWSMRARSAASG